MNDSGAPIDAPMGAPIDAAAMAALHRRLEAAARAEGLLEVAYTSIDSPVGRLLLAATPKGLVRVAFEREGFDEVLESLAARVSPRVLEAPARLDAVAAELEEYFHDVSGTAEIVDDCTVIIHDFTYDGTGLDVRIYGGIFTATEAAAVSLSFVLIYGTISGRLRWPDFVLSMRETAYQTGSLFFIAVGAKIFVSFVSLTGVTGGLVDIVSSSGLETWMILLCIVAIYLVMGMFLDPIGTMLLTLPFTVPLIEGMGFDLIWFGVIVVKLLEIGLITPPVGLNVFVINSVVGREIQVHTIFFGIMKFLVLDIVVLLALLAFPILSLGLPSLMF